MKDRFDEIVLVTAPRRVRIARLKERGVPEERARAVMRAQPPTRKLRRIATRTIDNSGTMETLREGARQLLRILCE